MTLFVLTEESESDLREIARYTLKTHGLKQVQHYKEKLKTKLNNIALGKTIARKFSEKFPQVLVTRCEHHFIFYIIENNEKPIIIAVIHENMDKMSHIKNRILVDDGMTVEGI